MEIKADILLLSGSINMRHSRATEPSIICWGVEKRRNCDEKASAIVLGGATIELGSCIIDRLLDQRGWRLSLRIEVEVWGYEKIDAETKATG